MLCDGALGLLKSGNINNRRKQINNGVSVVTYLYGQEELYEYARMNPKLQIFPVNYVNDPRVIGQNDNVVSVNSALSVDLIGQVAADSISADKIFSGALRGLWTLSGAPPSPRGANPSLPCPPLLWAARPPGLWSSLTPAGHHPLPV